MHASASLLVYAALVIFIITAMLGLSYFLGQRHRERGTTTPYESGIKVTDSARLRFPVKFYIAAMFFVIFDLEVVFILSWAIAYEALGWAGYVAMAIFVGVLAIVLLYEWRTGALDFGPQAKKILKAYHQKQKENEVVAEPRT